MVLDRQDAHRAAAAAARSDDAWLCLTCHAIVDGRQQAAAHEAAACHTCAISLRDLLVWCYRCNGPVHDKALASTLELLQSAVRKKPVPTELLDHGANSNDSFENDTSAPDIASEDELLMELHLDPHSMHDDASSHDDFVFPQDQLHLLMQSCVGEAPRLHCINEVEAQHCAEPGSHPHQEAHHLEDDHHMRDQDMEVPASVGADDGDSDADVLDAEFSECEDEEDEDSDGDPFNYLPASKRAAMYAELASSSPHLFQAPLQRKYQPLLQSFDLAGIAQLILSGKARRIVVMSGAGISVSAGIPDFRSPGTGLYDNLQKYNLPHPEAVFELSYFAENPSPFYLLARELFPGNYRPTPTHFFVRLLHEKGLLLRNYTQNIDTLERQAGVPGEALVEAHGSFAGAHCIQADCKREHDLDYVKHAIFSSRIARCLSCGGLVKPDIVFFGESLPRRFFDLMQQDFPECDLLMVLGTSLSVEPFASLIKRVDKCTPRLLINREVVGEVNPFARQLGFGGDYFDFHEATNYRDAKYLGDSDDGIWSLAELLGWKEELQRMIDSWQSPAANYSPPAPRPPLSQPSSKHRANEHAPPSRSSIDWSALPKPRSNSDPPHRSNSFPNSLSQSRFLMSSTVLHESPRVKSPLMSRPHRISADAADPLSGSWPGPHSGLDSSVVQFPPFHHVQSPLRPPLPEDSVTAMARPSAVGSCPPMLSVLTPHTPSPPTPLRTHSSHLDRDVHSD